MTTLRALRSKLNLFNQVNIYFKLTADYVLTFTCDDDVNTINATSEIYWPGSEESDKTHLVVLLFHVEFQLLSAPERKPRLRHHQIEQNGGAASEALYVQHCVPLLGLPIVQEMELDHMGLLSDRVSKCVFATWKFFVCGSWKRRIV